MRIANARRFYNITDMIEAEKLMDLIVSLRSAPDERTTETWLSRLSPDEKMAAEKLVRYGRGDTVTYGATTSRLAPLNDQERALLWKSPLLDLYATRGLAVA
jgi:hypothetical protein